MGLLVKNYNDFLRSPERATRSKGPYKVRRHHTTLSKSSEKEAEAIARLLLPDREEVWGQNAFSGIRMKERMSHMGYRYQEKNMANSGEF